MLSPYMESIGGKYTTEVKSFILMGPLSMPSSGSNTKKDKITPITAIPAPIQNGGCQHVIPTDQQYRYLTPS